jgi:hypothetical protein
MSFPWGAAMGAVGSFFSGRQQKKAADRYANSIISAAEKNAAAVEGLAEDYQGLNEFAFPQLKNVIQNEYAPMVGKDDPYLEAAHGENIRDIGREKEKATAESDFYWGATGNKGRGRGERLRIARNATEATNEENIGYGERQREQRIGSAGRFTNALSMLADIGRTGTSLAADAAGIRSQGATAAAGVKNQGSQDFYGDLGELGGTLVGDWLGGRDQKRMFDMIGTSKAPAGDGVDIGNLNIDELETLQTAFPAYWGTRKKRNTAALRG